MLRSSHLTRTEWRKRQSPTLHTAETQEEIIIIVTTTLIIETTSNTIETTLGINQAVIGTTNQASTTTVETTEEEGADIQTEAATSAVWPTTKPSTVTKEKTMRGEKPEATNFIKIATPNATTTTTTTTQRSRLQPYLPSVFSLVSPATGMPTRVHHIIWPTNAPISRHLKKSPIPGP